MEDSLKQVIEEAFASKKQQRYFFAKASDKSLSKKERKKWLKMAKEFSKKTNFKKIPEKAEEEIEMDEIVDEDGNIIKGSIPPDFRTKGTTSRSTTDDVARAVGGQMGGAGLDGGGNAARLMRYFGEADMSGALGYEETLGQDEDYEDAKEYFEDELDLPEDETKERLDQMGYIENAPRGVVRLVENPRKFVEEYVESILSKRSKANDMVEKDGEDTEMNPILKRQLETLKQTMKDNGVSIKQALKFLNNNE